MNSCIHCIWQQRPERKRRTLARRKRGAIPGCLGFHLRLL